MACCFRAPSTSDENPKFESSKASGKRSGSHLTGSAAEAAIPGKATPATYGKQPPVDRESPVSVLSGPGDDVSSDQRKPSHGEQEAGHGRQGLPQAQQQQHSQQEQPRPQPPQLQAHGARSKNMEYGTSDSEAMLSGASCTVEQPVPRGSTAPEGSWSVQEGLMAQKRRSGESRDLMQLPGARVDAMGRSSSPMASQKLHLKQDREHSLLQQQLKQQHQQQLLSSGDPGKDSFERQRLKQQLLQQQQQHAHRGGSSAGSSYGSALPGKSRILAWLDEADLTFATVVESENTPTSIHSGQSPVAGGMFLSSLKPGFYEDLAGKAVTRDVLIKRGMQRAQLLPDTAGPSSSDASPGSRSSTRGDAGQASHPAPKAPRPPLSPLPPCTSATTSGGAVEGSAQVSEGVSSALGSNARQAGEGARALAAQKGKWAGGVEGESAVASDGAVLGSWQEASPTMQGLVKKTQQQRSGEADGRGQLAVTSVGSTEQEDGDEEERGAENADDREDGATGGHSVRDNALSGPRTPLHARSQGGVGSSWPAMSPAKGIGGSTDKGSRGMAPTPEALSDLGRDSTAGSLDDSR